MGVFESKNAGAVGQEDGGDERSLDGRDAGDGSCTPSVMYAGTSGGVYKRAIKGAHWVQVNNGLVPEGMVKTSRALGVTSVQVDPFAPDTVYAATLAGLYKTTNGAASWVRIGESLQDQMIVAMVLDRTRAESSILPDGMAFTEARMVA